MNRIRLILVRKGLLPSVDIQVRIQLEFKWWKSVALACISYLLLLQLLLAT